MTALARRIGEALRRHRADAFGIGWILLFAFLFLSPALKDGPSFGPADLGSTLSPLTVGAVPLSHDCVTLVAPPPATCPHNNINGDQIDQAIPWNTTNYELVHAGEFPWWNTLEGNGLPQFLNFESAPLALPSLIGYLVPLSISFLVTVALKLLIAGLGTYWCCRLLRARPMAATLGGTAFMLSGPLTSWIGWSISGTFCWSGALLGALVWAYRTPVRLVPVAVLALAIAFAIYGGFAEAYVLIAGFLALVALGAATALLVSHRSISRGGIGRLALGSAGGLALSSPLWLPGISVLRASIRTGTVAAHGILIHGAALLFAQGYEGLPTTGSVYLSPPGTPGGLPDYFEATSYVGVVVLILAGVALWRSWRRPAVCGLALGGLGAFLLAYRLSSISPVQRLVVDLHLGAIDVARVLSLLALPLAILAAIGAEELASGPRERRTRQGLVLAGGAVAAVIFVLGVKSLSGLPQPELALRQASLYWPCATLAVLFVASLALLFSKGSTSSRSTRLLQSPGTVLVGLMLVLESAFLLFAGVGINSYAASDYPATPSTTELSKLVGRSLLALDSSGNATCFRGIPGVGYYPAMNTAYGVDELAVHDPAAPAAYFDSWPIPGVGQQPTASCNQANVFAPSVGTAALARRYGAGYVLAASGQPAPSGTTRVAAISSMTLYSVPGSSRFTIAADNASPPGAVEPRVISSKAGGDASWTLNLATPVAAVLEARITDSPGWHATSAGRPLAIRRVDSAFLSISVPAGTTQVVLRYRPPHLTLALLLALLAVIAMAGYGVVSHRSRASESPENAPQESSETAPTL